MVGNAKTVGLDIFVTLALCSLRLARYARVVREVAAGLEDEHQDVRNDAVRALSNIQSHLI